jgi:glucose/arabinose dehydrogenase
MFELFIAVTITTVSTSPWTVDYLSPPEGSVLEVGGIGFMSDGDLIASTRRGQVWRIDNPNAQNPNNATFTLICEGLHEGLGLAIIDDEIFVMQRGEIAKLVDLDDDMIIDEVQTITQDWGMSGNYHEFGFGLPADKDGDLYFSLNVGFWNPHWWHGKSRAPYRGWVLKVSPEGKVTPIAGGLRSPAGLGLMDDGTLLVTDNQGDWMAVCPVYAIKEGAFYGHPASLRWYEDQPNVEPSDTQPHPEVTREHPVLWLPYEWSRSTGNIIQDTTGGPFDGQYLLAELTNGQILRADFEEIDGVLQGACWLAHTRIGSAYHIEHGLDGTLYVGMTNRGWGGLAPGNGIARIKYNGEMPLEIKHAHLVKDGFEVEFTKPLKNLPTVTGQKYDYNYWWEYGSPKQHVEELFIPNVTLSEDGMALKVSIGNLEAGKCVMLAFENAISKDGQQLLHNKMSYTINKMPGGELVYVAKEVMPPIERGEEVDGWLYLTWADAFDVWHNNGVELCNAELDVSNPTQFVSSPGMSALVAQEGESMETMFEVTEGEIKMKYMLAEGSEAEIRLPHGLTVTLRDNQEGGYLGSGIWHDLQVRFTANPPGVTKVEINSVPTTIVTQNMSSIPVSRPIEIACTEGNVAFGDVRYRTTDKQPLSSDWSSLSYESNEIQFEGDVSVTSSDGGDIVVSGTGTIYVPHKNTFTSIQFDTKIDGSGFGKITIGDMDVFVATQGSQKTGSTTSHPINVNLVDQNEWCTIEIQQSLDTTVLLNGIPLLVGEAPSIKNGALSITISDAELSLRRFLIN